MKVLIACEESQRVCCAFRDSGYEAYSCDIQPCSGGHPEWHIHGDALEYINGSTMFETEDGNLHWVNGKWDLLIAHPPCTYLSSVGNQYFSIGKYGTKAIERARKREEAVSFFMKFINAKCDHIAVENPQGIMNVRYRKPDCVIHPYFFSNAIGDSDYHMKKTQFWLKNLPPLQRINDFPPPPPVYICPNGKRAYFEMTITSSSRAERAKIRSRTFQGVAKAMADQWGEIASEPFFMRSQFHFG